MASKGNKASEQYVDGPDSSCTSTGTSGQSLRTSVVEKGTHAMKGILGAERAKTYTPSGFSTKDQGGSAGGYGLPHGMAGSSSSSEDEPTGMPSFGYAGTPMFFEGGVRAGAVSAPETMPGQYKYPAKTGYDETSPFRPGGRGAAGNTVHGLSDVEGLPPSADDGATDSGADGETDGMAGSCPHGCGMKVRSSHGMAAHIRAKHGGNRGLGQAIMSRSSSKGHGMQVGMGGVPSSLGSHGSGLNPNKEYRGETEGPAQMGQVRAEFARAIAEAKPSEAYLSSYERGDRSGSFGRMSQLTRK